MQLPSLATLLSSSLTIGRHSPDGKNFAKDALNLATATFSPSSPSVLVGSVNLALMEMPPDQKKKDAPAPR
jgi:hypothetical protein